MKPEAGAMDDPVTEGEVSEAFARLTNGRAAGPDGVVGELLKYGPTGIAKRIAETITNGIEQGLPPSAYLGKGVLVPLQKPGKEEGPRKSLRSNALAGYSEGVLSRGLG